WGRAGDQTTHRATAASVLSCPLARVRDAARTRISRRGPPLRTRPLADLPRRPRPARRVPALRAAHVPGGRRADLPHLGHAVPALGTGGVLTLPHAPHLPPAALSLLHRRLPVVSRRTRRRAMGAGPALGAARPRGGPRGRPRVRRAHRPPGRGHHGGLPRARVVRAALLVGDGDALPAVVGLRPAAGGGRDRTRLSRGAGRRPPRADGPHARDRALLRAARRAVAGLAAV